MLVIKNRARLDIFLIFAKNMATLSKCTEKKVAAVITNNTFSQVYSIGINGGPIGGIDCLCKLSSKYTCIHAEANAIAKCHAQDHQKVMICTYSPCVTCASLIINSGFTSVIYMEEYHDTTGLSLLKKANVDVFQADITIRGELINGTIFD